MCQCRASHTEASTAVPLSRPQEVLRVLKAHTRLCFRQTIPLRAPTDNSAPRTSGSGALETVGCFSVEPRLVLVCGRSCSPTPLVHTWPTFGCQTFHEQQKAKAGQHLTHNCARAERMQRRSKNLPAVARSKETISSVHHKQLSTVCKWFNFNVERTV